MHARRARAQMEQMRAERDPNFAVQLAADARKEMELAEIKNGRLAMLAITIYALEEAITKNPVVQNSAARRLAYIMTPRVELSEVHWLIAHRCVPLRAVLEDCREPHDVQPGALLPVSLYFKNHNMSL